MHHAHPDTVVAAHAARQHGLVTYHQLLAAGLSSNAVTRRVEKNLLERLEPRVYRVASAARNYEQRLMQALLGAGASAAISHGTAARLYRLDGFTDYAAIELVLPRGRRYRRVKVHERSEIHPRDVSSVGALAVTRPPRTLLDLAANFDIDLFERAYESAVRNGLVADRATRRLLTPGAPGVVAARIVLERRRGRPPTASDLETRFLHLARREGYPEPDRQVPVERYRVNLAWVDRRVDRRVAVELDGGTHDGHAARRRDNRRQNRVLIGTSWLLLRYAWEDVVDEPDSVRAEFREAMSMRH